MYMFYVTKFVSYVLKQPCCSLIISVFKNATNLHMYEQHNHCIFKCTTNILHTNTLFCESQSIIYSSYLLHYFLAPSSPNG